jgi:nucleotide-binding universal stress UspA family protein
MYSKILIATDGSELAGRGVEQGVGLARALGAEVTIITVSEPWVPMGVDATGFAVTDFSLADEYERAARATGDEILAKARAKAADAGVTCQSAYVGRQYPADAILDYADENGMELIVMASHGRRGLGRLVLGSQTNEVLTRSKIPVLVVR